MALIKDSKDTTKLVKTAIRTLVNELQAERALVVFNAQQTSRPEPAAQYGFESENIWEDSTFPAAIVAEVLQQRTEIHMADARKDARTNQEVHSSVICLPVRGGFLYCDHSETGYLGKNQFEAIRQLAIEFNQTLRLLETPAPEPKSSRPKLEKRDLKKAADLYLDKYALIPVMSVLFLLASVATIGYLMQSL